MLLLLELHSQSNSTVKEEISELDSYNELQKASIQQALNEGKNK